MPAQEIGLFWNQRLARVVELRKTYSAMDGQSLIDMRPNEIIYSKVSLRKKQSTGQGSLTVSSLSTRNERLVSLARIGH
jgi:hypothetical protein